MKMHEKSQFPTDNERSTEKVSLNDPLLWSKRAKARGYQASQTMSGTRQKTKLKDIASSFFDF